MLHLPSLERGRCKEVMLAVIQRKLAALDTFSSIVKKLKCRKAYATTQLDR